MPACEMCAAMLGAIPRLTAIALEAGGKRPELALCDECGTVYILDPSGPRAATIGEIARLELTDPQFKSAREFQRCRARTRAASSN